MDMRSFERDDRVGENHEVRPRAGPIVRIAGIRIAAIIMCSHGGSEMAARGESPDADAIRIDSVFRRVRPHVTNGALPVPDLRRVVISRAETILQHKRGNSKV